jgi:hypothetical protein
VTFRHRAGVSPYTSSYDFAETCVFGKQSLGPFHCGRLRLEPARTLTLMRRPFSRSYGAILPSSLTRVLPIALVFSTRPPVSVLVRARASSLEAFLGGMASGTSLHRSSASRLRLCVPRISLRNALRGYPRTTSAWVSLAYPVPPSVITEATWYRNINRLSIAYAFRPRLRSRLTLRRLALLRKPWAFGGGVFHSSFVTRASILTSQASTASLPLPLQSAWERSPTTPSKARSPWLRLLA